MKRILFVCLGNICRSVAAEEVMRQKALQAGIEVEVDSAGLIDYHEGELADPRMRDHAYRRGYRLTHRSRPVTANDIRHFNWIVAMDDNNRKGLERQFGSNALTGKLMMAADGLQRHDAASIPDPYYGGDQGFEDVLGMIERASDGFVARLSPAR